ncbi:hypothetical protein AR158_C239R [Paramecium bursaria Chlorella virus AR158]|uniref:hypothetical protein n=1 Tax=Paramecium bursaria Chlorella virus AR158 TaxID=380598 RepID=UPI00015AA8A3|nr:hypothetical protein AR158_C239R [Paramecium bursaria Chlorella virus AR158]ABU43784.1 hypothetical protein AR158_C239R [Paramecium bursaria Chlorella virus AR158]
MSSSPSPDVNRSNYKKLVNIRQEGSTAGGQQFVQVYIPDTRRKRSPEAEARALARAEIKEQYKAAALSEELKLVKKQRNKLAGNLIKVGKEPSVVSGTPVTSVVSGTPTTSVVSGTPTTSVVSGTPKKSSTSGSARGGSYGPYSNPIGPLPNPDNMSGNVALFKNRPYNSKINYSNPIGPTLPGQKMSYDPSRNYSAPIGPLPRQNMSGSAGLFKNRPFDQQINYSAPIGPTLPGQKMSYDPSRNYSAPIGPLPRQNMSGSAGLFGQRPFDQQINYSQPIGPAQGPGLGMSFNRNRNYSAPIGPLPRQNMSGSAGLFGQRPFDQQINYSAPIGPVQGPGLGMSYDQNRNYPQPIGPLPRQNMSGSAGLFRNRPLNRKINYSQPIGPEPLSEDRPRNANFIPTASFLGQNTDESVGASPGRRTSEMVQNYSPSEEMASTPTTSSGGQRVWERVFNLKYKPGMNIIYVNKVYKQYRKKYSKDQKKLRILNKGLADAKTDPRLAIRGPLNLKPEQLLPGKTLAEVENLYKKKRTKAQAAGKTQFVEALDKAIALRRQQFGAKTPSTTKTPSPTKTSTPTSAEKNADMLLPGKTEDAVKRIYANRKTKALKKGNTSMAARLNRALPLRLKKIKTQSANVQKIPIERLIPGDTLQKVEEVYKQRRAAAQAKGRVALVQALDKAIIARRKQLGGSPGGSPGKSPSPSRSAIRTPTGKTPSPTDVERRAEQLLPGKTEQAVRKIHASRKAAAVKRKDMKLAAELDKLLPIRLRRIKTQGANVLKIPADKLIPGENLQQVEEVYKQRRAAAKAKGRDALIKALDKAIITRRKQLGGKSPSPSPSQRPAKGKKFSGLQSVPPEVLIPGKTLQQVEDEYKKRRGAAVAKKRSELVQRLNRNIVTRRKQLGGKSPSPSPSQRDVKGKKFSGLQSVPPEVLIPGKTLQQVEDEYKKRRGAAVAKKRSELVQRLNRNIVTRRKQLGGKSPSPSPSQRDVKGKKFSGLQSVPPEVLIPGKTLQQVEDEYKKRRGAAVAKKRTELVQRLNRNIVTRRKQLGGKSPSPSPSQRDVKGKKFSGLQSVPPEVLIPGKTLQQVEDEYKKRRAAAVAKKRSELVQRLNRNIVTRRKQLVDMQKKQQEETAKKSAEIQKKKQEEIKKKSAEIQKKKKDEEEKIQKEIRKTRQKLMKATTGIQKASANVQKFSREVEIASRRRDQSKVSKFTRAAERRRQNMQRAQSAREKFSSNLRQLENKLSKVKMTPVASPQGQILALEAPPPIMRKVTSVSPKKMRKVASAPISKMIQTSKPIISSTKQRRRLEDSARKDDTMQKQIRQDEMKRAQKERARKERARKEQKMREETAKKQRMMRPVSSMKVRRMQRRR